jgi:hypothetical protein
MVVITVKIRRIRFHFGQKVIQYFVRYERESVIAEFDFSFELRVCMHGVKWLISL